MTFEVEEVEHLLHCTVSWEYCFRDEKRLYPQIFVLRGVDIIAHFSSPRSADSNGTEKSTFKYHFQELDRCSLR